MKATEVLVVSLRGVNCRFWSHVRRSGQKANFLPIQVPLRVDYEQKLKIYDNGMTMLLKIQHLM